MSPIRHYMQSTASFPALVVLLLLLLSQTGGSSAAFLCEFPSKALLKQVQTTFSHSDRWSAKAGGVSWLGHSLREAKPSVIIISPALPKITVEMILRLPMYVHRHQSIRQRRKRKEMRNSRIQRKKRRKEKKNQKIKKLSYVLTDTI